MNKHCRQTEHWLQRSSSHVTWHPQRPGLLRMGSPVRPPQHSHSYWALISWDEKYSIDIDIYSCKNRGCGDSSVVRAPDSWLKGRGFESLLERRENFLLRVDFLCWLLFRYPFHPRVTTVARKKSRSFTLRIEPCFGIGHNLSLICQMTSEDIKHQLNNNNNCKNRAAIWRCTWRKQKDGQAWAHVIAMVTEMTCWNKKQTSVQVWLALYNFPIEVSSKPMAASLTSFYRILQVYDTRNSCWDDALKRKCILTIHATFNWLEICVEHTGRCS